MEETIQEGPVIKEKIPELFINGENTVAMMDINKFKGHRGSAFHGILIGAGGAEAAAEILLAGRIKDTHKSISAVPTLDFLCRPCVGGFPDCPGLCAEMSGISEKLYFQNERIYSAEYQGI